MPMFSKPDRRWHEEPGQDFDLREFDGRVATGRVATIRLLDERTERLTGKHVLLIVDRRHVTVVDRTEAKRVVVRVPWKSFVGATVHAEPGVPRLRLDLAIQLGIAIVRFVLWFDATERSRLDRLVAEIRRHTEAQAPAPPPPLPATPSNGKPVEVPLLDVRGAPAHPDWLVFLPGDCSAEVLRRVVAAPPPRNGAVE